MVTEFPHLKQILNRLNQSQSCEIGGVWGSAYIYLTSLVHEKLLPDRMPVRTDVHPGGTSVVRADKPSVTLIVTPGIEEAEAALEDLASFLPDIPRQYFPAWETTETFDPIILKDRLQTILALRKEHHPLIVVSPIQSLLQSVSSVQSLDEAMVTIHQGDKVKPSYITERLIKADFTRVDQVESPGEFSIRGGIIDIFSYEQAYPIRIELIGDTVESIREFNLTEQISERKLEEIKLCLIKARTRPGEMSNTLLDYLPPDALVILKEPKMITERGERYLDLSDAQQARLLHRSGFATVFKRLTTYPHISFHTLPLTEKPDEPSRFNLQITSLERFSGGVSQMLSELEALRKRGKQITIFCRNQAEISRLKELFAETSLKDDPNIELKIGWLHTGFHFREIDHFFISHNELFNRYRQVRRFRHLPTAKGEPRPYGREARPIETFLELAKGDFVVHLMHGIGRYLGIKRIQRDSFLQECLVIEYQDRARVYVPVYQIELVQKYVGGTDRRPQLSRLGTNEWHARKLRAKHSIEKLARELLEIQAIREKENGIAYPTDINPDQDVGTGWQTEFEASFPYEDTTDQIKVTEAIKRDMQSSRPMDRLICGDVGYGKTELAMRSAFKAATAGHQVAVLVPTTILAQQHYQNFSERMADYPINIEVLSRFRKPREQREITQRLKQGQIDIIIGTHRLLSSDVTEGLKKLGLIVIDEEQRFGVEHKERLKRMRAIVDVLTLTATPIPRTLHMALLGIRDISTLATPPQDRRAVETRVCRFDADLIREAILRELNRAGQVYFVHNRIYDIENIAEKLQRIIPEATLTVAHGQMSAEQLETRMNEFINGKIDILVSTNIIESGLDIPRVNTLFVNNADDFGLADLHQLRGRVGRYKHQAFAYFLIPSDRPVSPDASRRLKAIEEFNELGAGFKIALRDMEIRGVGNILGPEQHGHIAAIGYDLYCKLIEAAVKQVKNEPLRPMVETEFNLRIDAFLPVKYIPSERQRIEVYRRLSRAVSAEDLEKIKSLLEDRFGKPLPSEVINLIGVSKIRLLAQKHSISSLVQAETKPGEDGLIIASYLNHSKAKRQQSPDLIGAKRLERSNELIRIVDEKTMHFIIRKRHLHNPSKLLALMKTMLSIK